MVMDALELEEFGILVERDESSTDEELKSDIPIKKFHNDVVESQAAKFANDELTLAHIDHIEYSKSIANNANDGDDWRDLGVGLVKRNANLLPRKQIASGKPKRAPFGLSPPDFSNWDNIMNCGQIPGKRLPIFIIVLTAAQVALLIAMMVKGGVENITKNPMVGPPLDMVNKWGGKDTTKMRDNREVWRLVTSFLLHQGVIHLVFTLMWQLGMLLSIERNWGSLRVGVVYVVSGVGGNLLSSVFLPETVSVGATSCLIGIFGAMLAEILMNWFVNEAEWPWKGAVSMLFQILLFIVVGFVPVVDNYSNFGGVIAGFLASVCICRRQPIPGFKRERYMSKIFPLIRIFALVLLATFFGVLLGMLFGTIKWKCKACYLLSPGWDFFYQE